MSFYCLLTTDYCLLLIPLEEQRRVRPAEAEAVRERVVEARLAWLVGDVVEVALGVWVDVVDGRREPPVVDGEDGEDRLDAARGAEQVAGHRLRRTHRELVGVLAERLLDGERLELVIVGRRSPVRVDVADLLGPDARVL